jgi:Phosphodiester glycosidase
MAALDSAAGWHTVRPGLEVGELELAGDGVAWRLRVALVRMAPAAFRLDIAESVRAAGTRAAWSIDEAPAHAALAVNAGQFTGGQAWGWVVRDGRELQPPGVGPLSMALVIDRSGGARLVPVDSIAGLRGDARVVEAFQSYPALLRADGSVPDPLRAAGHGVDVEHRDARLAVGELRDGRLLFALTRFDGLGEAGGRLPFGPTTPEMAALMGALGCREAMLLDGGLSAQLLVRAAGGETRTWKGLRRVPLALLAFPRGRVGRADDAWRQPER